MLHVLEIYANLNETLIILRFIEIYRKLIYIYVVTFNFWSGLKEIYVLYRLHMILTNKNHFNPRIITNSTKICENWDEF